MANANGSIDEIIGQEARNQVQETTNLLKLMVDEFKVAVTQAKTLNTEISNAKGLAQMTTALEKMNITTAKATEATNKAAVAYEKLRQQEQITATKLEQTATQQAKTDKEKVNIEKAKLDLRLKEEAAAQKAIANLAKETKAAEIQASAYIKLREAHKLAEKAALEAGVTYGKNSEQFKLAAAESNKLRDQFVGLHKELGNNRDNVGNYGSALSKVWGGIRQLAYILPGLGIAGIFNLAGEAVIALADKMDLFKKKVDDLGEALVKGQKDSTAEVVSLDHLYKKTQDVTQSVQDRKAAVDKLQELYPNYFKNVKDEDFLNGKAKKSYDDLKDSIIATAKAKAIEGRMTEIINNGLDEEIRLKENARKASSEEVTNRGQPIAIRKFSGINKEWSTINMSPDEANAYRIEKKNIEQKQLDDFKAAQTAKLKVLEEGLNKEEKIVNSNPSITSTKVPEAKKVNRIDDLKKQMDDDIAVAKVAASEAYKTENELRQDILEIYKKYATEKLKAVKNLNKDEEHSSKQLGEQIVKDTQSIVEKQSAEINKQIKNDIDQHNRALKVKIKNNDERVKDEEKACDDIDKRNNKTFDKQKDDAEKLKKQREDEQKALMDAFQSMANSTFDIANSISDAIFSKQMQQFDARDKALAESYKNELKFIEQSGFSSAEKEKMKAKLAAENEAKQKQIDRERVTALRKQAKLQKALDINQAIASTALAVLKALGDKTIETPYLRIANAVAAGLIGAAQIARVIATPLPQYAKGRKGGKAEHAIVGEIGQEAIVTTDGKVTLTPSTPSLAYIPQGADVIPHNELIKNSAYVALAKQGTVTTDKLQMALIAEFEKNTEKIDELINVTKSKNLTATYNGLGGFESYKQANIR